MMAENSQIAGAPRPMACMSPVASRNSQTQWTDSRPRLIVGASTTGTRHDALDKGELRPDYVFFGKLDGDTHPDAHSKNIELANGGRHYRNPLHCHGRLHG